MFIKEIDLFYITFIDIKNNFKNKNNYSIIYIYL